VALRSRVEIEHGLRAARAELQFDPDDPFTLGAIAAYEWVLGRTNTAPSSRGALPATDSAFQIEEQYARRLIYSSFGAVQDYNVGVENALMWVRGATENIPVPLDRHPV
jgi:hypothetical protein